MKKLITIALILCVLAMTAVNCFAVEIVEFPDGREAIKDEIYTGGYVRIEYSLCDDGSGLYDFCGIKVVAVEEYVHEQISMYSYIIKTQRDADVLALCEYLEATGLFTNADPNYLCYDDEPTATLGDINMNGELDARDYVLAKRAYFGTAAISDEARELADVNQNGELDARDYVLIKRVYFGTATFGEANATDDEISA